MSATVVRVMDGRAVVTFSGPEAISAMLAETQAAAILAREAADEAAAVAETVGPAVMTLVDDPEEFAPAMTKGLPTKIVGDLIIGESAELNPAQYDVRLVGDGTATPGPYNQRVIPDDAPPYVVTFCDARPEQLPRSNREDNTVEILLGDSISTNRANSYGSTGMLTDVLRRHIAQHKSTATFLNKAIGGTSFAHLRLALTSTQCGYLGFTYISGKRWIDYIKDLAPTRIYLAFGMNVEDSPLTEVRKLLAEMKMWPNGGPDVVICTPLTPSPNDGDPSRLTIAEPERRLQTAGALRSYAKMNNIALLDFGRAHCMARDGYDPVSFTFKRQNGFPTPGSAFPTMVTDLVNRAIVYLPVAALACRYTVKFKPADLLNNNANSHVTFQIGAGGDDTLRIDRIGGNILARVQGGTFVDYPFWDDDYGVRVFGYEQNISPTVDGSGWATLEVATTTDFLTVRDMNSPVNLGEFTNPILATRIVTYGGRYQPKIIWGSSVASNVVAVYGDYGCERLNKPATRNSTLWGDGSTAIGPSGGSGYNHPSDFMATTVYLPVLQASRMFGQPMTDDADYDSLGLGAAVDAHSYWRGLARSGGVDIASPLFDNRTTFFRSTTRTGVSNRAGGTQSFAVGQPAITDLGYFATRTAGAGSEFDRLSLPFKIGSQGVFMIEGVSQATVDSGNDAAIFSLDDGTASNRIIAYIGQPGTRDTVAIDFLIGAEGFTPTFPAFPAGTPFRLVVAWSGGSLWTFLNGKKNFFTGAFTGDLSVLTTLRIGQDFNGAQQLRSFIREWRRWETCPTDLKKLIALSRIPSAVPAYHGPVGIRGPYASDAAAATAGVPVGGQYKTSAGSVTERQA